MAVPILGAIPVAAPTFTLRVHRGPNMTMLEVVRDSDGVTVATCPFANELWDQLFHTHDAPEPEPMTEDPHIASVELVTETARQIAGRDPFEESLVQADEVILRGERDPEQIAGRDDV